MLLSRRSDTLIMASATPHDGKAASFASLMNMLNPTAIANPDDYGPEDIKGLFLRRYKKHVQEQVSGSFLEREVSKRAVPASPEEEAVYDRLAEARFLSFDKTKRTGQLLFKTVTGARDLDARRLASMAVACPNRIPFDLQENAIVNTRGEPTLMEPCEKTFSVVEFVAAQSLQEPQNATNRNRRASPAKTGHCK